MNPEVSALVARLLANDIPMDVFLARMGQLGITPSEAQTIASNAAGGGTNSTDPSLENYRHEPLSASDAAATQRNMSIDPLSGQVPEQGYPRFSRPMTQEEIVLARPVEERTPILPRMVQRAQEIAQEARRGLTQESGTPSPQISYGAPSGGASAGSQIAQTPRPSTTAPSTSSAPVVPNAAPQSSINLTEDRASRARFGDLPNDFGSPMGSMAYAGQLPGNLSPSTVEQAVNVAKRTAAAPQMASAQTSTPSASSDLLHTLIRGRFGDAARGNPMDDRLTAFQEARDKSGEARASGGAVQGKDAALHKALEIIHHLIRTR